MSSKNSTDRIHVDSSYYPEHWPEHRWADNIQRVKEAGFTVAWP